MKKPAFTLLETMIALVVVAAAIAASAQASRVLYRSAAESELLAQAGVLADESIVALQKTAETLVAQGGNVEGFFYLSGNSSRELVPYLTGSPAALAYCVNTGAGLQAGQPIVNCGSVRSDIMQAGAPYTMTFFFADGGEVVAVNRSALAPESRGIIDVTTSTALAGDEVEENDEHWDFYRRQITVRQNTQLIGGATAIEATVIVQSLADSNLVVRRSALINVRP